MMEYIELRHMVDNTILDPAVSGHFEWRYTLDCELDIQRYVVRPGCTAGE
jgi:hypothetical protein